MTTITSSDPSSTAEPSIDEQAAEEFAGTLLDLFTGCFLTYLIDIGRRTGLFEAATAGPATSEQLASRAGLDERHVREWLGAMVTGGIMEHDADSGRCWLPAEHAVCLTGRTVENMAPVAYLAAELGRHVDAVAESFRTGAGVPYQQYLPEFRDVMDALWQPMCEQTLVSGTVPLVDGLDDRLRRGARVADVACGSGNALLALGEAYPSSTFVGYDLDAGGVQVARDRASEAGLTNVGFEVCDAVQLVTPEPLDVAFVFNAVHDQADPSGFLATIHASLAPDGVFVMDEPRVSSHLHENVGVPGAALTYAVSTMHCMVVSLAEGGAGLGTAWGEQVAVQLLADAGFVGIEVHDSPADPGNAIFVARKAG